MMADILITGHFSQGWRVRGKIFQLILARVGKSEVKFPKSMEIMLNTKNHVEQQELFFFVSTKVSKELYHFNKNSQLGSVM